MIERSFNRILISVSSFGGRPLVRITSNGSCRTPGAPASESTTSSSRQSSYSEETNSIGGPALALTDSRVNPGPEVFLVPLSPAALPPMVISISVMASRVATYLSGISTSWPGPTPSFVIAKLTPTHIPHCVGPGNCPHYSPVAGLPSGFVPIKSRNFADNASSLMIAGWPISSE